jgi:hypothetical protein
MSQINGMKCGQKTAMIAKCYLLKQSIQSIREILVILSKKFNRPCPTYVNSRRLAVMPVT